MLYEWKLSLKYLRIFVLSVILICYLSMGGDRIYCYFYPRAPVHTLQHHFFCRRERAHFISQLHPAPILIGQIWNFAAYQTRFCSLTWHLKWLGTLSRTRDMTSWSLVFFSSAKFTQKMSIKLFISYTTVFGIQFSFQMYSLYVSMTFVTAGLLV